MSEQNEVAVLDSLQCADLMNGAEPWRFEREIGAISNGRITVIPTAALEAKDRDIAVFKALIDFLLSTSHAMPFLAAWREGNFDACKREWPDSPAILYPAIAGETE